MWKPWPMLKQCERKIISLCDSLLYSWMESLSQNFLSISICLSVSISNDCPIHVSDDVNVKDFFLIKRPQPESHGIP